LQHVWRTGEQVKLPNRLDLDALQAKITEEHLPDVRPWRGTPQFAVANRAMRRKGLPPAPPVPDDTVREPRCPRPSQHRKGVVHERSSDLS